MNKRVIILLSFITLTFFSFSSVKESNYFRIAKNLELFSNLYKEVNTSYVDEVEVAGLMREGLKSMLGSLDPYTNYISEATIEEARLQRAGGQGDIGVKLVGKDGRIFIGELLEGQAAMISGLQAGDEIVAIEGKKLKDKSIEDVELAIKGQPETILTMDIKRYGKDEVEEVQILREEAKPQDVTFSKMVNDTVGYVQLRSFTQNCGSFVQKEIEDLKKDNDLKYLIFDLRNNGGGLLKEAILTCNIFVDKGIEVVSTKGKLPEWDKSYKTPNDPLDTEIPLVILVNDRSASASEIVSGTIQDLDRGIVIGQRSFGKGLVQQVRDIGDTGYKAKVKLTVAKYFTASGRCVQAVDYSGRYSDAGAKEVADSLLNKFYTKNGRLVYDNSGVTPDIKIEKQKNSLFTQQLLNDLIIFDYVNKYSANIDSIAPPLHFQFTDADFNDFVNFVKNSNFTYETESENIIIDLQASTKEEKYFEVVNDELQALKQKITNIKSEEILNYKKEIKTLLKHEIISRYYYQDGYIEATQDDDLEIKEAIILFNNLSKYKSVLTGDI